MWLLLVLYVVVLKCDLLVWFGLVENICIVHWFVNWLVQSSFQHLMLIFDACSVFSFQSPY